MAGMIKRAAIATLLMLAAGQAMAERGLLDTLMARPPAAISEPAMSTLALEACLKLAASLDRTGVKIAGQGARLERLNAEHAALESQINAELDQLSHYDAQQMAAFQRRVARNDDVERELRSDRAAHQKERKAHDEAIVSFERNCGGRFRADDLVAVKAKLGLN
jgi:hypothetical protein